MASLARGSLARGSLAGGGASLTSAIRLSKANVPEASPVGTIVGQLTCDIPGAVLSIVAGPFIIDGLNRLVTDAVTGAAGTTATARIRAVALEPYVEVTLDFTITSRAVDGPAAPVLLEAPVITGIRTAGQVLEAVLANWTNGPILSRQRRFYRSEDGESDWTVLAGETDGELELGAGLIGKHIRAGEIATNAGGPSDEAFSDSVGPIAPELSIGGDPLEQVTVGQPYAWTPEILGGHSPYVVTNVGTALPAGWAIEEETGELTGYAGAAGSVPNIRLRVTDADGLTAELDPFTVLIAAALSPKWLNSSFRATLAGPGSWADFADLNDDENTTSVVTAATPLYPTLSSDGVFNHGKAGTGGSFSDATKASGIDVLLSGSHAFTTASSNLYTREAQPGEYEFRIALGGAAGSGQQNAIMVFDGLANQLASSMQNINLASFRLWAASTAVSGTMYIASLVDGSCWSLTTPGTTGTVQPSGGATGSTFNDGSAVWTRLARTALLVLNATTTSTGQVVSQQNTVVATSAWRAVEPKSITITGDYGPGVCVCRFGNLAPNIRQLSLRLKTAPLADISLIDDYGLPAGATPRFYAKQPAAHRAFRVSTTSGAAGVGNIAFGGDIGPYYTPTLINGAVWAVAKSSPLPDGLAGVDRTLTITQTDAASPASPHVTTLHCEVVSSQGRPVNDGTWQGQVTTQNWLNRKRIKDIIADGLWPGYTGQALISDTVVTTTTEFLTALKALPLDGDDNWRAISLSGPGPFNGSDLTTIKKDFMGPNNRGGLLIKRAAGQDPDFNLSMTALMLRGVHVGDIKSTGDRSLGSTYQWRWADPGPAGIGSAGRFAVAKFEGTRFGFLLADGATEQQAGTESGKKSSFPISMLHGESVEVLNCKFDGCATVYGFTGVRKVKLTGNDYVRLYGDGLGLSNASWYDSTQDVFEDNDIYVDRTGEVTRREIDYSGYTNGAHKDDIQIRKFMQAVSLWNPNAGKNNSQLAQDKWNVGDYVLNRRVTPERIYRVTATTGNGFSGGGTGPAGDTAGLIDGNVTWAYVADYTTASTLHINVEDCTTMSTTPISAGGDRQAFIDSLGPYGCSINLSYNNNAYAGVSSYGVGLTCAGEAHVEFNTFAAPYTTTPAKEISSAQISSDRGKLRALHNVTRNASTSKIAYSRYDERVLSWTAASGASTADSALTGPFERIDGKWSYADFDDTASNSTSAFAAELRAILKAKAGTAGIVS